MNVRNSIIQEVRTVLIDKENIELALQGLPYTSFPENLEPEAGFFAILDFTKNKRYENIRI